MRSWTPILHAKLSSCTLDRLEGYKGGVVRVDTKKAYIAVGL